MVVPYVTFEISAGIVVAGPFIALKFVTGTKGRAICATAGVALGVAALVMIFIAGSSVVVFRGAPPALAHDKYLVLGHETIEDLEVDADGKSWIVNATPAVLKYEVIGYGTDGGPGGEIKPKSAAHAPDPDYFGADNRPPDSVESKSSSETRVWVTW